MTCFYDLGTGDAAKGEVNQSQPNRPALSLIETNDGQSPSTKKNAALEFIVYPSNSFTKLQISTMKKKDDQLTSFVVSKIVSA